MDKTQESGASLSTSDQLPSLNPANNLKTEPLPRSTQGVLAFFEKASLKTQQLVIAIIAGVASSLAVVAANQVSAPTMTGLSQPILTSLVALVTALVVGAIAFSLGQLSANQVNRSLDELQTQFKAVARGDLSIQPLGDSPKELEELASSFQEMTFALDTRLSQANQRVKEQRKANEELQSQLIQLQREQELAEFGSVIVEPEVLIAEDEAPVPQEKLMDLVAKMQGGFEAPLNVEAATSSTMEEIKQYREDLQYRSAWLQALLNETNREIEFISFYEPEEKVTPNQEVK